MQCSFCERTDTECKIKCIKGVCYCPLHLTRHYRKQDMQDKSIYSPNEHVYYDDHAEIILCDKHGKEIARALVDLDDVEKCKAYKWHVRKSRNTDYVIASLPNNAKVHLHRLITGYNGELDVDHINLNGLDNRKSNLRVITHSENISNNKATGVTKVPSGRYQARIYRDYHTIYLGTFDTYEEATAARNHFINQ